MRFIHMADVHFDSPFTVLASRENLANERRLEQRKAFADTIEYIKENKIPQGKIIIYVARDAISKMTGQKRCNILKLKEMGYDAKITADSKTGKYQLYIIRNEEL